MKAIQITSFATFLPTIWLALLNCPVPTSTMAETETNATYVKLRQASNDVQGVIQALPDVEKLWPNQPETYFKSAKEAAGILAGTVNKTESKQAMLILWTNMLQKPLPQDEQKATGCLELKWNTISIFLNVEEFSGDKARWIDMAKYIGEIRSRTITNYVNQSMSISVLDLPPEDMERLLEENQRHLATDQLQQTLRIQDRILCFFLINHVNNSSGFLSNDLKTIASAAHLNEEEMTKLKSKTK